MKNLVVAVMLSAVCAFSFANVAFADFQVPGAAVATPCPVGIQQGQICPPAPVAGTRWLCGVAPAGQQPPGICTQNYIIDNNGNAHFGGCRCV